VTGAGPLLEKISKGGQFEEVVGGFLFHRRGAGDGRLGIDQVYRGVGGATGFAVVAILVVRLALGAGALDIAVGEEQVFFRVEGLGDLAGDDIAVGPQGLVDQLGKVAVLFRVGGMVVVKADEEIAKILLVAGLDLLD